MKMNMEELAQELHRKFITRTEAYLLQSKDGSYYKKTSELTLDDIEQHLRGEKTIGTYQIGTDNKVKYLCLDVDLEKAAIKNDQITDTQWQMLRDTAKELITVSAELNLDPILEFSGRRGYHVIVFFENPVDAAVAKRLCSEIRDKLTTIPDEIDIEVFPKQEKVLNYGCVLKLPLGIHKVTGNRSEFLDPETFEPVADPLGLLKNNNPASIPDVPTGMQLDQTGLEKMISQCPIVQDFESDPTRVNYDCWIGIASNYRVFDGGWERFVEVSMRDTDRFEQDAIDRLKDDLKSWNGPQSYDKFREQKLEFDLPEDSPKAPAGWGSRLNLDSVLNRLKNGGSQALQRHFVEEYHSLSLTTQFSWVERLSTELDIPQAALLAMAGSSFRKINLTDRNLKDLMIRSHRYALSAEDKGQMIYKWFTSNGATAYRDREHSCYWVWKGMVYDISDNQPFKTLIWKEAKLTHEGIDSRKIWAVLKAETDCQGKELMSYSWIFTDCNKHKIYINPNNTDSKLIRITTEGVSTVANGANEEKILLAPAAKMQSCELKEVDVTTWEIFDRLILGNMPCARHDQLLYGCWMLCYPLIDYIKTIPHFRCEGIAGAGKTRAMDLISHFVYGDFQIKKATDAANFADAAKNPLILLDNIETKNFTSGLADFVLTASTGIQKEKRKIGTDHDVVIEKVRCLLTTNGIENLGKREHITRTLLIEFDRWEYPSENWSERVYGEISASRSELFSAHMMLISKVLGKIASGGIERWMEYLGTNHPNHSKDRANSFLSLMALILEELLQNIDSDRKPEDVVSMWITTQDEIGRETAKETNSIVSFLESIWEDYNQESTDYDKLLNWGYEVKFGPDKIAGTASQLLHTFNAVAKRKGMRCEYENARQLAKRIKDSEGVLSDKGISVRHVLNRSKTKVYYFAFDAGCR